MSPRMTDGGIESRINDSRKNTISTTMMAPSDHSMAEREREREQATVHVRRERSLKYREFGLYAGASRVPPKHRQSSISAKPHTASASDSTPLASSFQNTDHFQHPGDSTDTNTNFLTSSPSAKSTTSTSTKSTTTTTTTTKTITTTLSSSSSSTLRDDDDSSAPQLPPLPISPITPRWDSLIHSTAIIYDPTLSSPTQQKFPIYGQPEIPSYLEEDEGWADSESRDDYYPLPAPKMNSTDGRPRTSDTAPVENFSRPRKSSIRSNHADSTRYRSDVTSNHPQWPRERGNSASSNQTSSTFASLPVRPSYNHDTYSQDNPRGRSRTAQALPSRPPVSFSRTESNGPAYYRDAVPREPLPRMASLPTDELRASFRSQLSTSTAPHTLATERSSILTKGSSTTSIYGTVDEGLSVDDVMGLYEKGFGDSEIEDNHFEGSRPPTAKSELSRRGTALLEAMSKPMVPIAKSLTVPDSAPIIRDSAAIFGAPNPPASASPDEEKSDLAVKHDSGKLVETDSEEEFPGPKRQDTVETTASEADTDRDRYGFRKENQYVSRQQYDEWNSTYTEYLSRRRRKWTAFLKENGLMTDDPDRFPARSAKTKRFVRKGIPPDWRGAAWFYYAGGPSILAKHGGVYASLLQQTAKLVDVEAIERDLHRTFPDNIKFRTSKAPNTEPTADRNSSSTLKETKGPTPKPGESPMITSLRRVLYAFSIYNPRIGYCQSLNFLAGLLLLFVETEEQAFWLLNIITRVYLPGTHEMSLEGANVDLGVLMTSLREAMPAVWAKVGGELDGTEAKPKARRRPGKAVVNERLPPITLCMTAWFMSCFIGTLPMESVLRVWDVFFYEGSKTLFRISLTIFKIGENEIKSVGDPMEIFQVVQTIPRRLIDANGLMEACFKRRNGFGHLSQDTIETRRQERREGVRLEREKLASGQRAAESADADADVRRKGTLFGARRKQKTLPAEAMQRTP